MLKNMVVFLIWIAILSTISYFFVEALEIEAQFQEKQVAEHIAGLKNRVNMDDRYPPFLLKEHQSSGLGYWERKKK